MAENAVLARHRRTIDWAREQWAHRGVAGDVDRCIVELADEVERLSAWTARLRVTLGKDKG
jgi:hypothetical protein